MTLDSGFRTVTDMLLHDVDDKSHRVAVDYPVQLDTYKTDFGPGAFADGWRRRLPILNVDHSVTPVGRAIRAESLPDRHRLVGRFDDTAPGRRAYEDVRDGTFPGWSFEYFNGRTIPHPSGQRSALRFTKAEMKSYGPVWRPSIPGTEVVGLRSVAGVQDRSVLLEVDRIRRGTSPYVDSPYEPGSALDAAWFKARAIVDTEDAANSTLDRLNRRSRDRLVTRALRTIASQDSRQPGRNGARR